MKPAGAESGRSVARTIPGRRAIVLKKVTVAGQEIMVIGGSDAEGCLYGVYGLLEDHYGIGFYLGGDVLPDKKAPLVLPAVDERKTPAVAIRGFLPWTNFPQSATFYSWDDWRFIIDQAAKMRINFIHIHNYNGESGHNEPFHNFEVSGNTVAGVDAHRPDRPRLVLPRVGRDRIPVRRGGPVRRLRFRLGLRAAQRSVCPTRRSSARACRCSSGSSPTPIPAACASAWGWTST